MTTDKALDLALDSAVPSILSPGWVMIRDKDFAAIKQARSAPVQEPVAVTYKEVADTMNALWGGTLVQVQIAMEMANRKLYTTPPAAQPAPVQEPVAFNAGVPLLYPEMKDGETISVEYTTPPAAQRQWIGLTDEEMNDITCGMVKGWVMERLAIAIEAKLKEKNT